MATTIDPSIIVYVFVGLTILLGAIFAMSKKNTVMNTNKWAFALPLFVIGAVLIAMQMGYLADMGLPHIGATHKIPGTQVTYMFAGGAVTGAGGAGSTVTTFQPSASYATQDKYSATSISGTAYYKEGVSLSGNDVTGGNPVVTTEITKVSSGKQYAYWVSNASYWVIPKLFTATDTNNIVNKEVWANGTGTITAYDLIAKAAITSGVANTSLGANAQANIEYTYQATNKKSAVPFGGVFVVEYNSTITDVSCSGDGIVGTNSKFQVTYSPSATSMISKQYELVYGFDDGTGKVRTINCQFNNGATSAAGSPAIVKILPANYYVSTAGDIILDTEKAADADNTRTGSLINLPTATTYWK